jgi:hypothetical protein
MIPQMVLKDLANCGFKDSLPTQTVQKNLPRYFRSLVHYASSFKPHT